jgi:hypothetical protein
MYGAQNTQISDGITPVVLNDDDRLVTAAHTHALQRLNAGMHWREILNMLAKSGERITGPDSASSILVLDENGLLRNGASPGLPPDYLGAIDGLKPDPMVGTCASAAATGTLVITLDFSADDKWAEFRHWPHSLGFVSAWALPIKSESGAVLGTFGTYYCQLRSPSPRELNGIERLVAIAVEVLAAR